jgi:hypothetical protein
MFSVVITYAGVQAGSSVGLLAAFVGPFQSVDIFSWLVVIIIIRVITLKNI